MPIDVIQKDVKFFNQLTNGVDFSENTSDYTQNLVGNVGEYVLLQCSYAIACTANSSVSNLFTYSESDGHSIITRAQGSFIADGFFVGDNIYVNTVPHADGTGIIETITDKQIVFTGILVGISGITPPERDDMEIWNLTPPDALIYSYNLLGQNESINFNFRLTGNDQSFYARNIYTNNPNSVIFDTIGKFKDWVTSVPDIDNTVVYNNMYLTKYHVYDIQHCFSIEPCVPDEEFDNIRTGKLPKYLQSSKTFNYAYQVDFRQVLSNPNTSKTKKSTGLKGCVGGFGENFNGFKNLYAIDSIDYISNTTLGVLDSILLSGKTDITITVTGTFNTGDKCAIYISYVPFQEEYTDTFTDYEYNFIKDYLVLEIDGGEVTGSNVFQNATAVLDDGNLVITAQTEYSFAQQFRVNDLARYLIWVQVADSNLSAGNSDRVALLADANYFTISDDIDGLFKITSWENFIHNQVAITEGDGTTDLTTFVEDGVVSRVGFKLDLSKQAFLNELTFILLTYNSAEQKYSVLDEYKINLSNIVVSNGTQKLTESTTRGYLLKNNDNFNLISFEYIETISDFAYYKIIVSQKIAWEEYMANSDIDTVFYDPNKVNNGLNFLTSLYQSNGYSIRLGVFANCTGINTFGKSGFTNYLGITPNITVKTYDEEITWTKTIALYNATTNVSVSKISTSSDTIFEVTWVSDTPYVGDFFAIHRIQQSEQETKQIYELSSIVDSYEKNILKPIDGESYLKLEYIDEFTIKTTCLINASRVNSTLNYVLSARLFDGMNTIFAKLTEDGQIKLTEDGQIKIPE